MLQNPFLPAPSAANAWAEGFTKDFSSISSPEPGENVGSDDIEAFNQRKSFLKLGRTALNLQLPVSTLE